LIVYVVTALAHDWKTIIGVAVSKQAALPLTDKARRNTSMAYGGESDHWSGEWPRWRHRYGYVVEAKEWEVTE
jgi:hypothetical protein